MHLLSVSSANLVLSCFSFFATSFSVVFKNSGDFASIDVIARTRSTNWMSDQKKDLLTEYIVNVFVFKS